MTTPRFLSFYTFDDNYYSFSIFSSILLSEKLISLTMSSGVAVGTHIGIVAGSRPAKVRRPGPQAGTQCTAVKAVDRKIEAGVQMS